MDGSGTDSIMATSTLPNKLAPSPGSRTTILLVSKGSKTSLVSSRKSKGILVVVSATYRYPAILVTVPSVWTALEPHGSKNCIAPAVLVMLIDSNVISCPPRLTHAPLVLKTPHSSVSSTAAFVFNALAKNPAVGVVFRAMFIPLLKVPDNQPAGVAAATWPEIETVGAGLFPAG